MHVKGFKLKASSISWWNKGMQAQSNIADGKSLLN
jgi:hypothetical protein